MAKPSPDTPERPQRQIGSHNSKCSRTYAYNITLSNYRLATGEKHTQRVSDI